MFTWICPQCGREVPPAYNDCPDCSKKAAADPAQPQAPVAAPPGYPPPPPQGYVPPQAYPPPPPPAQQPYYPPPPYQAPPPPQQQAPPPGYYPPQPQAPPPPQYYQQPPQPQSAQPEYYPPQPQAPPPPQYYPQPQQPQAAQPEAYPQQPQAPPPQPYYQQPPQPPPPPPLPPTPPEYYTVAETTPRKFNLPIWLMTVIFAVVICGAGWGLYSLLSTNKSSEGSGPTPAAGVENPAAKAGAKTNSFQKYIEISGVRFVADPKNKAATLAKFVVINHSEADISGLAGNVTIWARTQKSEEDAQGTFNFTTDLGPFGSKEMTVPLNTKHKIYELGDWQNLTTDVQITAPE